MQPLRGHNFPHFSNVDRNVDFERRHEAMWPGCKSTTVCCQTMSLRGESTPRCHWHRVTWQCLVLYGMSLAKIAAGFVA
jgi:hypothetical protein